MCEHTSRGRQRLRAEWWEQSARQSAHGLAGNAGSCLRGSRARRISAEHLEHGRLGRGRAVGVAHVALDVAHAHPRPRPARRRRPEPQHRPPAARLHGVRPRRDDGDPGPPLQLLRAALRLPRQARAPVSAREDTCLGVTGSGRTVRSERGGAGWREEGEPALGAGARRAYWGTVPARALTSASAQARERVHERRHARARAPAGT